MTALPKHNTQKRIKNQELIADLGTFNQEPKINFRVIAQNVRKTTIDFQQTLKNNCPLKAGRNV